VTVLLETLFTSSMVRMILILLILGFCASSIVLVWAIRNNRLLRRLMPLLSLNDKND